MNKNYPISYPLGSSLASMTAIARVLLIEDDYSYAELVKIFLDETDQFTCDVVHSQTLVEGLEQLADDKEFDVVLLDLTLPDSNGLETLHKLLFAFPNTNVIVLTSNSDQEQGIKTVSAGAQDFLIKGDFKPEHLARSLRFSMERKQIITRLEEIQHLAKIGHWELRPAYQYFEAGNEVYRFFRLDPTDEKGTYETIQSRKCPLHVLGMHQLHYEEEEEYSQVLHLQHSDGSYSYAQLYSKRKITIQGDYVYIGSLQDITLQKKAEALEYAQGLAEETARVREQVIATVSHELRTPMNAILGLTNVIDRGNFDESQNECIENIQEASQTLLSIINDILLTSSLQNNKEEINPASFDMPLTIRRISEALMHKASAKNLVLHYNISELLPQYLMGDKQRVSQVLYNLIGNAIKFTDKGIIELKVFPGIQEKEVQWVRFEVHDTGFGIEESKLEEIFQPFNRINKQGRKIEGTGLGLTIAHQIVQQMGGELQVSSREGEGSVFSFILPFEQTDSSAGGVPVATEHKKDNTSHQALNFNSVMVVEDHPMNQLVIRRTLEKKWPHLQIVMADTGEQAIEMLATLQVDLILMDLQLPGIDGYETSRRIRTQLAAQYEHTPILAMTAQPRVANDNNYREAGMDDYILKPFDPAVLFQKITQYLSQ